MTKYNVDDFHPGTSKIPSHVGLIPDGIRRWSRINGSNLLNGYNLAMENLVKIVDHLFSEQVKTISIYLCSDYNFKRNKEEVDAMCQSEGWFCKALVPSLSARYDTKVIAVGQLEYLPDHFIESIQAIQIMTENNITTQLNLCVAYNPICEIQSAIDKCKGKISFLEYLGVRDPIDLIIRSSGANLLSNFLLLQSGFARLYFINKLFNDVVVSDIKNILENFQNIQRRYGS